MEEQKNQKVKKTDMHRSIGKQSGESVNSVLHEEEKEGYTVGRIGRKRF